MLKVLGQSRPTADTPVSAYTCPTDIGCVVSTFAVCNTYSGVGYFSMAIRPNGETLADKHWVFKDTPISGQDTFAATCGFTLSSGDIVTVESSSGQLSFSLFGQEVEQ